MTKNSKIIPGYKTDHSAITLTFCATLGKRGRGYWKFNSQHLLDNNYVEKVKTCLRDTLEEYAIPGENLDDLLNVQLKCNDQLFFEIIKMKIRSITIEYSITKSKREREFTKSLENEILHLDNIMNMSPSNETRLT